MVGKAIHLLRQYLKYNEDLYQKQIARINELSEYHGIELHPIHSSSGHCFYSAKKKGEKKYKYIGGDEDPIVKGIKELRYLEKSVSVLEKNNRLIRQLLKGYYPANMKSINILLPKVYQNTQSINYKADSHKALTWKEKACAYKARFEPYKPEQLTVPTIDGTFVRSKSEALIYNLLVSLGVVFVYELPLKTKTRMFLPDFTILSEIDYETEIIIEHLGMMSKEFYRNENFDKIMDYMKENYVQGVNIYYTFDYMDGGLDLTCIFDIISLKIRPSCFAA